MNQKTREKQSILVRGIAAQVQAMHMPTFENLRDILAKFGWILKRDETNQQTKDDKNHREG